MVVRKKISFRTTKTIEKKATDILNKAHKYGFYNFNSHTPIDLIVEKILKLQISFINLNEDFQGILGALDLNNKIIWLDSSLNHIETNNFTDEARCNFTIGHECGHYIFHRSLYSDYEDITLFHDINNPKTKMIETQANIFASYILMPTSLVMFKWSKIDYFAPFENTLFELARFFRVSREAMANRLKTAGLIDSNYQ
jgi:Zn-dependent peptidase ImmA (M78 family)